MPIFSAVLGIPFHTEWNYGGDTVFLLKYFVYNLRARVGICCCYFTTISLILISVYGENALITSHVSFNGVVTDVKLSLSMP
jgi:hypothetical protein